MNKKTFVAVGAVLWIIGGVMTIVGMNIEGDTGKWISIIGNILFLVGLLIEGVWYFKSRRDKEKEEESTGSAK